MTETASQLLGRIYSKQPTFFRCGLERWSKRKGLLADSAKSNGEPREQNGPIKQHSLVYDQATFPQGNFRITVG